MVSGDGIDILVDLAGHTAQNRLPLFARKAAPVQLSYCGYPNTTGLAEIDYYVTDANLDSEDDASLYTERLLRIPGCFCCYMPSDNTPQVNDLPALRAGHITFGSLHPLMRLSGAVLDLFSAVLKAAPSARLRIVRDTLQGEAKRRLEGEFLKRGIDPLRIDLVHELPRQGHLALYHGIDIALDTFPWSGHTAACESLWMGVPTVTLFGNRHAGRMAATILRNVGLPQWVAASEEDYCAVACRAAADFDKLKTMRRNLRQQMVASIVCDAQEFTRKLEAAYTTAWRNWRSTQL
jgi:predicted O-linked N-acetylglucosamine transferase (SPINDLY family)